MPDDDRIRLIQIIHTASEHLTQADQAALEILSEILTSDQQLAAQDTVLQFRTRFQQLTGPLMAKAVEDTLFYRQHMALALNEVGADPLLPDFSVSNFYAQMQARFEQQPEGLCTTSTHDTKRGEDSRARLYTLTEAPERWANLLAHWRKAHQHQVEVLTDGAAPEPSVEWMICQALAGAWPPALQADNVTGLQALEARFIPYVEKALREAKLRTQWGDNNPDYEQAVLGYARYIFSPAAHAWRSEFICLLQPFIRAGLVNSLSQTLIKLTAPGIADIYQGSELWDFSLVDPDNRRQPDFDTLERFADRFDASTLTAESNWLNGSLKQYLIGTLLHFRQRHQDLFSEGNFVPLTACGRQSHKVIAFARQHGDQVLIVILPRQILSDLSNSYDFLGATCWSGNEVILPEQLAGRRYFNVLHNEETLLNDRIDIAKISGALPFIVLSN